MEGLILIAVLAIMGGAIAYIGDKLGTKVGKKRVSLLGLRPKHTAILVTIATGIMISSVTLGIMTLLSNDVRTALFGMEKLNAELAGLNREVGTKTAELEISQKELQIKTAEHIALDEKVGKTTAQLQEITVQFERAEAERTRAMQALQTARGELSQAQGKVKDLQTTKDELDKKVAALGEARVQLQGDVTRLNELAARLKKGIETVREGTVIFRAGEALHTDAIAIRSTQDEIEQQVKEVLQNANSVISKRLGLEKEIDLLMIADDEFKKICAKLYENRDTNMIVRITALGNTIYGEPVLGRIDIFPNRLVYSEGTTVYKETVIIDYTHNGEEILLTFLQKVNGEGIKQGLLPDPLQGTVGSIGGAELFESISRLKNHNGKVEIAAIAKKDINTVGPLVINIRIRPVL